MEEFKKGQNIPLEFKGGEASVIEKLGEGGQGIVYRVSYNGKQYALKWYFPNKIKNQAAFKKNLEQNIASGAPSAQFLWPLFITKQQYGSFGYLMDLRPKQYVDFSQILNAKVKFNLTSTVNAALHITNSFGELHQKGYSYQDINDGNFFIDPSSGKVLICDNDNVAPDQANLGIAGKPRYMAPEVVTGKKMPECYTDRFSLSVVLFMLLCRAHPLEGVKAIAHVCLTESAEKKLYGSEPVFIFDPADVSNRPVRGVHNNPIKLWPMYPNFVQESFIKAFTKGIKEPHTRITEKEWQKIFIKLREELFTCFCGHDDLITNFDALPDSKIKCRSCKAEFLMPLKLQCKKEEVLLYPGNKLYAYHTGGGDSYDMETGEVIQNKSNPALWGIRNMSDQSWHIKMPDGKAKNVGKNSVVPILKGVELDFGGNSGTII